MRHWPAIGFLAALLGVAEGGWAQAQGADTQERPIRLDWRVGEGGAPFDEGELTAAVELRAMVAAEPRPGAVAVAVTSPEPGWIEIASEGRRRRIALGGAVGTDAARLVAVIVVDAAHAGGALPASPPFPSAVVARPAAAAPSASPRSRWALAAVVGMGVRTTDAGPGIAPGLEVGWSFVSRGRVILSGAVERAEVSVKGMPAGQGGVALTSYPIRFGAAWRFGAAELRAGVATRPYAVSGLDARSGTVWGGFCAVAGEVPARGPLGVIAMLGLDVYPQPLAFTDGEQRILTLRTLAPFVGLGAVWRGRRG